MTRMVTRIYCVCCSSGLSSLTIVAPADECAVYALTYGGSETDVVNAVTATADGGFAVTG